MLFVAVFSVELALKFTAVAEKLAVPAPLIEDPALKSKVPLPVKAKVAAEATLNSPLWAPPLFKLSVPLLAFTVPVLLNATPTDVVPVPPVFSNVPALLNTPGVTPCCTITSSF
jgi:hypothetical protein